MACMRSLATGCGSFNYALMTGDTEPMKKVDPADVYVNICRNLLIMYENDLGWMYGTDTPVTLSSWQKWFTEEGVR